MVTGRAAIHLILDHGQKAYVRAMNGTFVPVNIAVARVIAADMSLTLRNLENFPYYAMRVSNEQHCANCETRFYHNGEFE